MKRRFAIALCLVMLLTLAACNSGEAKNTDQSTEPSQSTTESTQAPTGGTTQPSAAPTDGTTQPSAAPTDGTTEPSAAPTNKPEPAKCSHTYKAATCTAPKTCTKCGATEGKAAGHSYKDATCTAPKTCSKCGATEGQAAGHSWKDATCTAPKTCSKCGATEGQAAGHSWKDATCTAAKTCTKCGATEGEAAAHSYSNGACTVCGKADTNVPFTGNMWHAYIVSPGFMNTGEVLWVYSLIPTELQGYSCKDYYSNVNYESENYGSITYNGKTYYDFSFSGADGGMEWEDNGDTVTVTFHGDSANQIVLTRTGETQFTVKSSSYTSIPVGTIFNKQ